MKSEKCFLLFVKTILGEPKIQRSEQNCLQLATDGYTTLLGVFLPPDSLQAFLSSARR